MTAIKTLHYMPGSCALSCHIALEWAGAAYDLHRLAHEDLGSDAFLAINPKGKVPALVLMDGTIITEALAILVHVAATHDRIDGLMPTDTLTRSAMMEALAELTGEFHPAFAPLHVPHRYTDDPEAHDGVRRAAVDRIRRYYDRWNERMEGRLWILGAERSVADAYLYVMCRWTGMIDSKIDEWPALHAFLMRMETDQGVWAALDDEGLT